jgi:hypothetical protein
LEFLFYFIFLSFTFLFYLIQVTFPRVKVRLKLDSFQRNVPQLTQVCFHFVIATDQIVKKLMNNILKLYQVGPMLVTHWGLSGPAILRLSAWGARYLFSSGYKGKRKSFIGIFIVPFFLLQILLSFGCRETCCRFYPWRACRKFENHAFPPQASICGKL